jgi:two-component system sensor histidine kinase/response regulator
MNITAFQKNTPLILIVDDDRTTRKILRRAMEQEGYQVAEASDGGQGLEAYALLNPDMVLLDAKMPVMDGFTCCSKLRATDSGCRTPVLMITSLEDEKSVDRAFEAGATDYITKPIHWAVLRLRVRRLLQERQAEAEILKALQREKELSDLKSRIVSMVSHEYRNPLTAILSSAELLEYYGNQWNEEKKLEHLHRIQAAVQHLSDLVGDMLCISQAEAGKLTFKPAPLDLEAFCMHLVTEAQLTAGPQHQIIFVCHHSPESTLPRAALDEKLLRQILSNLLSNAIKYSPNGGSVRLELTWENDAAIFRISDSGIGIPPADLGKLFNSFSRGSNVGTLPGTGLGLAIVKRCVDLHGGKIALDSEVGAGTAVTVTLPLKSRLAD